MGILGAYILKKNWVILTSTFLYITTLATSNSYAVYGGESALGTERVVAISESQNSREATCSGSLLAPRIVLTVAHCLTDTWGSEFKIRGGYFGFWVSQPGVNFKVDDLSTRVQSSYVVIPDDYMSSTPHKDIAFIFLSKPIDIGSYPKIAREDQVKRLKSEKAIITHYGYGKSDEYTTTGKPNKVDLKISLFDSVKVGDTILEIENFGIATTATENADLCKGDSGGPFYAQMDGELLIVANLVGAGGCQGRGYGHFPTFGVLMHQYESLLWKKWEYFLAYEATVVDRAAIDKKITINCSKGKIIKKITAKNPKCPKGYKKVAN